MFWGCMLVKQVEGLIVFLGVVTFGVVLYRNQ